VTGKNENGSTRPLTVSVSPKRGWARGGTV
jgi:hypothetical protein